MVEKSGRKVEKIEGVGKSLDKTEFRSFAFSFAVYAPIANCKTGKHFSKLQTQVFRILFYFVAPIKHPVSFQISFISNGSTVSAPNGMRTVWRVEIEI